jgi:2-(1,2-epoxy-1,2-dihydrophenyl)acetyl-CoA isomerase
VRRQPPCVRLERNGPVATVAIDRPEARNTITRAVGLEIYEAVSAMARDRSVSVLVFRGVGSDFCCGADLKYGAAGSAAVTPGAGAGAGAGEASAPTMEIHQISILLHEMPAITLAAIRGGCAGAGLGWACACDLRVADVNARFNTAFLDVGVAGDMSVPWSLPRLIGASRARDLSFLPRKLLAQEAHDIGLVTRLWSSDSFEGELAALVERLAGFAPQAMAALKSNYVAAERVDLRSFVLLEAERHNRLLQSDDCREAFTARKEKRPPKFTGR